jgi:type III secretion protein L
MTWLLAWHRAPGVSVSTDAQVLLPQDARAFGQVGDLVQALATHLAEEEARIEVARARAREAGWEAGWAAGQAEAREQAARALADTLQGLAMQAQADRQALQDAVLTLALLVIKRMACSLAPEAVLVALLRQVLAQQLPAGPVSIRLHPDLLDGVRAGWVLPDGMDRICDWRADDTLGALDCVVETPAGRLLAGLPAQLEQVERLLRTARACQAGTPASNVQPVETETP